MSSPAIRVENLGKRYRLGATHSQTLGALLSSTAGRLFGRHDGHSPAPKLPGNDPSQMDEAGNFWALKDVSFDVQPGEVVGIIGRNGAGKSTLLKILSNIASPTIGHVELHGRVASLLEVGTGFHPELTGRENVYLNGAILGMSKAEIRHKFDEIVAFAEIDEFIDTPVKRYSSGMYVRLAFAVAAHLDPEILIVDEVLAVGDGAFQRKCLRAMDNMSINGRTVIFVSHNVPALLHLTQRLILLESGHIINNGLPPAVVNDYLQRNAADRCVNLAGRSDRHGNGLLRFVEVNFLGENGEASDTFSCGSHGRIRLTLHNLSKKPLQRLAITVGIDDSMGHRITHLSTTVQKADFPTVISDIGFVEFNIPRIPFSPGRYTITVFCTVQDEIADWVQSAAEFDVADGDYFHSGRLFASHEGEVFIDHSVVFSPGTI
jgi:homopolymeric O-antigen transport system ATP-binding protein